MARCLCLRLWLWLWWCYPRVPATSSAEGRMVLSICIVYIVFWCAMTVYDGMVLGGSWPV